MSHNARPRILTAIALALPLAAAPALAHHGWGSYDAAKVLTLTGKVQGMTYANPHGTLRLDAPGKVWTVVLAPPSRMQNRGLPADMIKPGVTVTVVGYPHKTDQSELRAERITVDGKTTELR